MEYRRSLGLSWARSMPRIALLAALTLLAACSRDDTPIAPEPPAPAPAPAPAPQAPPAVEFVEEKPTKTAGPLPSVTAKAPTKNQLIPADKSADFEIKFDLKNWKLEPKGGGKAVHVILDNEKTRRIVDLKRPLKLGDFSGGKPLAEGQHLLAILPVHPNGESVKPANRRSPIALVPFFVEKKTDPEWRDTDPLVLLNILASNKVSAEGTLIDYYVDNKELTKGKVVLHAAVSGPDLAKGESISAWKPWRIKNARPGDHIAKIQLFHFVPDSFESGSAISVNLVSKPIPGKFTSVTRQFVLDP